MKKLYAPWRAWYASAINEGKSTQATANDCPFCTNFAAHDDEKHFIIKRYELVVAILNLYPYNAGHMMILPYRHVACLDQLSVAERAELIEATSYAAQKVQSALGAHAVNIGMNLGKAAGAGIPSHLHMHVLPRFEGDTNFLPTLADTKQVSFDLRQIYQKIKKAYDL